MAQNRPLSNVPYDPVRRDDVFDRERDLPSIPMNDLPLGAARPRFMGAALADDGPRPMSSYSSLRENTPSPGPGYSRQGSEYYGDSVYGLNGESSSVNGDRYRDDPFSAEALGAGPMHTPLDYPTGSKSGKGGFFEGKRSQYAAPRTRTRRRFLLFAGLAAGALVVLIVALAVFFGIVKPKENQSSSGPGTNNGGNGGGSGGNSSSPAGTPKNAVVTGGNGSTVTLDDGSKFAYINNFGGYWYQDSNAPFANNARAQSWSPALNETFQYGVDQIRGVNLGGWLVTEPFIVPALYEKYENSTLNSIDEWTLSINMREDTSEGGGIGQLEAHYQTFITEQDFAEIAAAGLNFVRIPLPYWAIEVRGDEPFLEGVCWQYFLKAVEWARKYGLRINLDFHSLPGSQNGWNHSGRLGTFNVMYGPMGYANAQRSLDYIRIIAEFIAQPEYASVIQIFGITNEPQGTDITLPILQEYYLQAYEIVRNITGTGEGKGPYISYHDGFVGQQRWAGFMSGADRIVLDTHPYVAFTGQSSAPMSTFVPQPCSLWGGVVNNSQSAFGLSTAGEFSNAVNDCGLWVNGVKQGVRFEGTFPGYSTFVGSCEPYTDWANWNETYKGEIKQWALNSMDALQYYFFWTWKIGNSSITGTVEAPQWSYQLGLQNGWMPTDPREAIGACGNTNPRAAPPEPWMTGGAGAGVITPAAIAGLVWPPESIVNGGEVNTMVYYTPTGAVPTLPAPTYTLDNGTVVGGSGWYDSNDKAGAMVNVTGCEYPDPWYGDDADTAIATPWCSVANAVAARTPAPTPAPTAVNARS